MKRGQDIALQARELYIVHHNKPGQVLDAHRHDEHHLFIPLRGRVALDLDGEKPLDCPVGRMAYVPAGVDHRFRSDEREGERLIVLIDGAAWTRRKLFVSVAAALPAQQLLKELLVFMLLNSKSRAMDSLVTSFLVALSESLETATGFELGDTDRASRTSDPQIRKAVDFLNENFREELKIAQVARAAGMSERTLTRAFARELGLSPKNYLVRLRIEQAASQLRAGRSSVTEAAFDVGYSSLSAFIEAFRAVKGRLPSDFAKV